ncbi:MAG: dipeptidase, partial [Chthoniobacterales bacterium]
MRDDTINYAERTRRLLNETIACDLHSCPTYDPRSDAILQLRRYRQAGVKFVCVNVGDSDMTLEEVIVLFASFRAQLNQHPDEFLVINSVDEIEAADGTLAVSFDLEGARALGENLALLELLYDLGVRWMLPVYNVRNQVGGGCHDPVDKGLTDFGRAFIREMDRIGLIKCCSHVGYRTARDILDMTEAPTIFSHSNPRALCDHPRNIPDDLMSAAAATGGVVGINGIGIFLGDDAAGSETIVRHVDYAVQLIGPQHVAIALDSVFDKRNLESRLQSAVQIWPASAGYRTGAQMAEPEQWPEII